MISNGYNSVDRVAVNCVVVTTVSSLIPSNRVTVIL